MYMIIKIQLLGEMFLVKLALLAVTVERLRNLFIFFAIVYTKIIPQRVSETPRKVF